MRDRTLPVRPELERVLGREFTDDVLRCLTHAETLDTSGSGDVVGMRRDGGRKARRYTARARHLTHAVRGEEDTAVRRACVLLLLIVERMRPTNRGNARALSKALWLGRLRGAEGQWGLAGKVGVSVRQLEHYLAVLAPIVARWQPPAKTVPAFVGRRSGHAYAIYELRREMPRETKIALGGSWVRKQRPEKRVHDVAPEVARAEREASTRVPEPIAALIPDAPAPPRTSSVEILGGPRTGPPGADDLFRRLIPL